ncbi:MAG TPA: hypothetical protein VF228_14335 [Iamia sp.]
MADQATVPWFMVVVYLVVLFVALRLRVRHDLRRTYEDIAYGRWDPVAPGPTHDRLQPVVAQLEAEGYALDSYAVLPLRPRPVPAVALVHRDGSLAMVRCLRTNIGVHRVYLDIESILLPGERALCTASFAGLVTQPEALAEVAARRPDVGATVARHRAARRWVSSQGIEVHPVPLGGAGPIIEAGMRAAARQRVMIPLLTLLHQLITGGGRLRRPMAERTELIPRAAAVRRQQELARAEAQP